MPDLLKEYFDGLTESVFSTLKTPDAYLNKIALTAIIIAIGTLLYMTLKKIATRNENDFKRRIRTRKVLKNTMTTLTILGALFIWVQAINVLVLIALLFGVFIAFMVRGLTTNITAYFVIRYRKYFEIGHRIEINNIIGDVIDITPISIKMLEVRGGLSSDANTGRTIKLPNSIIFDESIEIIGVANSFVWHELKYVVSFDSDWQTAEKIMTEAGQAYFEETILTELEETNGVSPRNQEALHPVFSVDTNDAGIILTLRYLVDYQHGTSVKTAFQRKILPQLNDHPKIEFAIMEVKVFQG